MIKKIASTIIHDKLLKREKCRITATAVQKSLLLVSFFERLRSKKPYKKNKASDKLSIINNVRFCTFNLREFLEK